MGEGGRVPWVPGTSYRILSDGSIHRDVINEGVLLDHALRLQGAVEEIRRFKGSVPDEFRWDDREAGFDDWLVSVFDRWGV